MKRPLAALFFALCCVPIAVAQNSGDPYSYTLRDRGYRNTVLGINWQAPATPAEARVHGDLNATKVLREENRKDGILFRSENQTFFANPNRIGCCSSRGDAGLSENGNPAGPTYYAPGEFRVSLTRLESDGAPCDLLKTRLHAERTVPDVHIEVVLAPIALNLGGQPFCRADWKVAGQKPYPTIFVGTYIAVRSGYALTWEFRADSQRELKAKARSMSSLKLAQPEPATNR